MTDERAYSTSDPAIVAAYRSTCDAYLAMARRVEKDAAELGNNKGALLIRGVFGKPRVVGLEPDNPTEPPEGWRYVQSRRQLEPRRGKAGEAARQWLADHQPPDVRGVLAEHGLPVYSRHGNIYSSPGLFEHDGTVWALFRGTPEGDCTWTPRKLSEFHAAREAAEEVAA